MSEDLVAKTLHLQGNEEFKRSNYAMARDYYTQLLAYLSSANLPPNSWIYFATILSNRAAVYLKLGYPELAWSDATYSLRLESSSLKATYRLCTAYVEMDLPDLARQLLLVAQSNASINGAGNSGTEVEAITQLLRTCNISDSLNHPASDCQMVRLVYRDYEWELRSPGEKISLRFLRKLFFSGGEDGEALTSDEDSPFSLQQLEPVGRSLINRRAQCAPGQILFSSPLSVSAVCGRDRCGHCSFPFSQLPADRFEPLPACPKCRACFCCGDCYSSAMEQYHSVLCGKEKLVSELHQIAQSFPTECLTAPLLLKIFAMAKYSGVHPLQLPILRYLKRLRLPCSRCSASSHSCTDCDSHDFWLPTRFADCYCITMEILGKRFEVNFDFWVYLTVHRYLMVNCIHLALDQQVSFGRFEYLSPAISMINHSFSPNCILRFNYSKTPLHVSLVATKRIEKGEELTVSYVPVDASECSQMLGQFGIFEVVA